MRADQTMPLFAFKALSASGEMSRGRLDARNELDLEARLRRMGLELVSVRQLAGLAHQARSARISRRERLALCFDLEQIVRAGLPILDGLRELAASCDQPGLRSVLSCLIEEIEGGRTVSQAMATFPKVFDGVFVSLVRAGEQSGRLDEILEGLARSLRWQDELLAQSRKLLIYPALVCVVVLLVAAFLLVYLVPQVATLLRTMGTELPLQTRALIAVSGFVVHWWWLGILLPTIAAALLAHAIRIRPAVRMRFDRWKLRTPVIGPILRKVTVARFAAAFALLYRSGIGILDALRSTEEVVGNQAVALALQDAAVRIRAGSRLSDGLERTALFPPLVLRMLRMGESTGSLENALKNVHYFYERDVRESIERGLKTIEPMLTLILGGMLALILFAVLTPVYEVLGRIRV